MSTVALAAAVILGFGSGWFGAEGLSTRNWSLFAAAVGAWLLSLACWGAVWS